MILNDIIRGLWPTIMFRLRQSKSLRLEEMAALIARNLETRDLPEMLQAIYKNRRRSDLFCAKDANEVFAKLLDLSKMDSGSAEAELLELNTPPRLGTGVSSVQVISSQVFQLLVELNTAFSQSFNIELLKRCLTVPTQMGFALCHSTVVAKLAGQQPDLLDSSLIEVVITSADDSRAIYALKVAKWLPKWSDAKSAVLGAMLSKVVPKQLEAMWLVNERGTIDEVLSFAETTRIDIPKVVIQSGDIRALTRLVVESTRHEALHGIAYALKVDGSPISAEEYKKMSDKIRDDLESER